MKTFLFVLLVVGAGAGLYVRHIHHSREQQSRLLALEEHLRQAEARAGEEERRSQALQAKLTERHLQVTAKTAEADELKRTLAKTNSPSASKPSPSAGAKLLQDPSMRATMKKQHLQAAERSVQQIVTADLVQRLNLNEEQVRVLKELLGRKAAAGVDMLMALMSGEDEASVAALGKAMKSQKESLEAQLQSLLGEEGYQALTWQENSQTERGRLKEFRKKFEEAGQGLSAGQEDQLFLAMFEERRAFPFQTDYNDASKFDYENLAEFFTEEKFNVFFREMDQLNERIRQRAQSILSPEQLDRFGAMQQEQLEKSRMTIRMTQALFPVRRAP